MAPTSPSKPSNKLTGELAALLPHLQLDAQGTAVLQGCSDVVDALARLEKAGLLIEATRLVAHALPAREVVWWACACSRHTASSGENPALETKAREAAEAWVRRQSEEHRRAAMKEAEAAGYGSAEAWAAVAAFWSGGSMAPPEAPSVPPPPHLKGLAASGAVALAAVRGQVARRDARLQRFLASARDIATGGAGPIDAEKD